MPWGKFDPQSSSAALMAQGRAIPPFHGRCRCVVVATAESDTQGYAETDESAIMRLPGYENARIPIEKLTEYALNPLRAPDKARAFKEALGYELEDADELILQIHKKLPESPAKPKGDNGYGQRYEVIMKLVGKNKKTAKVLTAWIVDNKTNETRLISVYVDKE